MLLDKRIYNKGQKVKYVRHDDFLKMNQQTKDKNGQASNIIIHKIRVSHLMPYVKINSVFELKSL